MTDTRSFTLALQEGFDDDTVVISTASKIHEQLEHVSTRNQIGLARELTVTVPADATALKIALPDKGIEQDVALDGGDGTHLGASVDPVSGRITVRRSAEPFGYV
jgi:hypothetical protein